VSRECVLGALWATDALPGMKTWSDAPVMFRGRVRWAWRAWVFCGLRCTARSKTVHREPAPGGYGTLLGSLISPRRVRGRSEYKGLGAKPGQLALTGPNR